MKPEVDMKDEKVVNHVGVVAVLGMQVHNPAEQVYDDISGHDLEGQGLAESERVKVKRIQVATPG